MGAGSLKVLKKANGGALDAAFHQAHDEVFSRFDCLTCANCCKTTGPLFTQKDIETLARRFRMPPGAFVETYLRLDEDGDYVLKSVPCPFLLPDNRCSVYEDRPRACREYPHTDRRNMKEILSLTEKNIAVCPAVEQIVAKVLAGMQR
jgi:hypothetical protein